MYTTCLHCHSALKGNDRVASFPVGSKLAFDPARGRLWVVCPSCTRWNLSALEERWEAIEECERLYRDTRQRTTTDTIGLAHVDVSLDLIRIGKSPSSEIAAWRYAGELRGRWLTRGAPLAVAGAAAAGTSNVFMPFGFGVAIAASVALCGIAWTVKSRYARARIVSADGRVATVKGRKLGQIRLEPVAEGWGVRLYAEVDTQVLSGAAAARTLRSVVTARNYLGARPKEVADGLALLTESGDAQRFVVRLARATQTTGIHSLPPSFAMALEMALHDESERRAMAGELRALEAEWELAEEIAHIADNLLLPDHVRQRLDELGGMSSLPVNDSPTLRGTA